MKLIIARIILFFFVLQTSAFGMSSGSYSIPSLTPNYGSGTRTSQNYQISSDAITGQAVGALSSNDHTVLGTGLSSTGTLPFMAGVYITSNEDVTGSSDTTLNLICSSPDGCTDVSVSNNGVSWSDPSPYSTSMSWVLPSNDGQKIVFVKYRNGSGEWSGICSDSIVLDTTPPTTTISPVSGTFMENPQVTLTSSEPATIFYTLDESDPTTSSAVYTDPIPLDTDTVIKCFSVDPVGNEGPVVESGKYTVCSGSNLSIFGQVIDATIMEGVPLVTVTLSNGDTTAVTPDGAFSFTGLNRGYYTISAITSASAGYVTYLKEIELCMGNEEDYDILLTKNETVFGGDTFSGYSEDSVNTATGNFFYGASDLSIPGRGFSFSFDRAYNSQDSRNGPLGYGWTHNYNISLTEYEENVTVRWGDGKAETWTSDDAGGYDPMQGVFGTLTKDITDNTFSIQQKDLIRYNFDSGNRLSSISDENGNELTFEYSGDNLSAIIDTSGRRIEFQSDAQGRITRILDPIGRSITFAYDVNGDLVNSVNRNGHAVSYAYDGNHQIMSVTDPKGIKIASIEYDEQRRVVSSQRDALGSQTLYSYDTLTKTTQIIDPEGNVSFHLFDDLLRLVKETDANGNSATYEFNAQGNIDSVTDKNGNKTSYTYDPRGNVILKEDPLLFRTTAEYNDKNNPIEKVDANGNRTIFEYDPEKEANLIKRMDPLNNETEYEYDEFGQLREVINHLDEKTTYEYDQYGNRTSVIDALQNKSMFTYDLVGRKLSEIHPLGRATAFEYDDMDNLISVTDALGGTSFFVYDENGNKIEHIDALGNKTTFSYDAKNRLISQTNALGYAEHYTYDKLDRRIAVTNSRGNTFKIVYDGIGNVIQEIDATGSTVRYEYDANGNKTRAIDALGNAISYTYDAKNRLTAVTDALGKTTTTTYDPNGNILTVTDPLGKITTSTYDVLNRLLTVTDPLGNMISNEYDALGRIVKVTDARGNFSELDYDEVGRLVKVTDTNGGEVYASYDEVGNRLSMTDTRGNAITYEYDRLNRLIRTEDPLGNAEAMTYDAVGNLISLSDADGTTTYRYDDVYRLTSINYPDATIVAYTYDETGNRTSVSDQAGMTSYAYNVLDQIQSVTDPFGMTVEYAYDPRGIRNAIKYPGNKTVSYSHDAVSRLVSVSDWTGTTTRYRHDEAGRIVNKVMGNGSTVFFGYDDAGRLIEKTDETSTAQIISSYTYVLDENGNRTEMNMVQPLLPAIKYFDDNFSYNDGHEIVSSDTKTFTHDGKGNRVEQVKDSITTQYAYNPDNMLVRMEKAGDVDEYIYTSDGYRLASIRNGTETRYLLDVTGGMENILARMDSENNIQEYYIYGDGLLYTIETGTGRKHFHHYDPLGSTIAITDKDENITDQFAYLPYGESAGSTVGRGTPFSFVGKYGVMKEENGLYFMRARYYDPETKRFLSKDPVKGEMKNSQTLSPYIYGEGNPLIYIDPKGEAKLWDILIDTAKEKIADDFLMKVALKSKDFNTIVSATTTKITMNFLGAAQNTMELTYAACAMAEGAYDSWNSVNDPSHGEGIDSTYGGYVIGSIIGGSARKAWNWKRTGSTKTVDSEYLIQTDNSGNRSKVGSSQNSITNNDVSKRNSGRIKATLKNSELAQSEKSETVETDTNERPPTDIRYYDVGHYASRHFKKEFSKLKNPHFFDAQTSSYIEYRIQSELFRLQKKRYKYNLNANNAREQWRAAKQEMMGDIRQSGARLYASLTQALSKYSVLVRDLDKLPSFKSGSTNRSGVYAN